MSNYTGYIYSITNEINGKSYIGKTNDLVRRWKEHCYGHGGTSVLDKAFKKYGLENFIFDIVAQIPFSSIKELNNVLSQLEIYYIELYDSFKNGYNATIGGEGTSFYHHSEETKKKMSESQKGRTLTEEHKAKCGLAFKGHHHTEEAKESIKQALLKRDHGIYDRIAEKRRGVKMNPEVVMKGAIKRRKPILQYDLQGNFIKEWEGAFCIEGSEKSNIGMCCKGKLISSQGFIWRYKKDADFPLKIEVPSKWNSFKKPVVQYDLEGRFISEYASISEASRATGLRTSGICQCLKGVNTTCGKYIWAYKEDKISESINAISINHTWEKSVIQFDKNGIYINKYESISQAATLSKVGRTSINNCLHGRSKTAGGFVWKFKEGMEVKNEAQ